MSATDHNPQDLSELSLDNLPYYPDLDYTMATHLLFTGFAYRGRYAAMADKLEDKGWKVRDTQFSPTMAAINDLFEPAEWNYWGGDPNGRIIADPGFQAVGNDIFGQESMDFFTFQPDLDERGQLPSDRDATHLYQGPHAWVTFADLKHMLQSNMIRTMYTIKRVNLILKSYEFGQHGGRPAKLPVP